MEKIDLKELFLKSCWCSRMVQIKYDKKSDSLYIHANCMDYSSYLLRLTNVSEQPVKSAVKKKYDVVLELQNVDYTIHAISTNMYEQLLDVLADVLMNHRIGTTYRDAEGYQRLIWKNDKINETYERNFEHNKDNKNNRMRDLLVSFDNNVERNVTCLDIDRDNYKAQAIINSILMFTGDIRTEVAYWYTREHEQSINNKAFRYGKGVYNELIELGFGEEFAIRSLNSIFGDFVSYNAFNKQSNMLSYEF